MGEADGAPEGAAKMMVAMFDENGHGQGVQRRNGVPDVEHARLVHRARDRAHDVPQVVHQQVEPLLAKRADLVKMSDLHDMCTEHSSDTSQCAKSCTSKLSPCWQSEPRTCRVSGGVSDKQY